MAIDPYFTQNLIRGNPFGNILDLERGLGMYQKGRRIGGQQRLSDLYRQQAESGEMDRDALLAQMAQYDPEKAIQMRRNASGQGVVRGLTGNAMIRQQNLEADRETRGKMAVRINRVVDYLNSAEGNTIQDPEISPVVNEIRVLNAQLIKPLSKNDLDDEINRRFRSRSATLAETRFADTNVDDAYRSADAHLKTQADYYKNTRGMMGKIFTLLSRAANGNPIAADQAAKILTQSLDNSVVMPIEMEGIGSKSLVNRIEGFMDKIVAGYEFTATDLRNLQDSALEMAKNANSVVGELGKGAYDVWMNRAPDDVSDREKEKARRYYLSKMKTFKIPIPAPVQFKESLILEDRTVYEDEQGVMSEGQADENRVKAIEAKKKEFGL